MLSEVIESYLLLNPSKKHAIEKTALAFNALVGINAESHEEYWELVDGYFVPDLHTFTNENE